MTALYVLGRVLFGGYFLYSGIKHFQNGKGLTEYAKMKGVPSASMAVTGTGILMVLGGAGVFLNMYVQYSAVLLLISLVPITFMMHAFWKKGMDATAKMNENIAFLKNLALVGALLMLLK